MFNFDFGGGMGGGGGRRGAKPDVDTTKFYTLLGVEKNATEAEIKKAFRKQAMTHHPDRGGDAETFKQLNKAYEVLSDPNKRQVYDEGGEEAINDQTNGGGGGGGAGMDIFDLFSGFGGGGRGGGGRGNRVRKGEDVVFPLKVTLEDLYNGVAKKLRLTKNVICSDCRGKGGKDGAEISCKDCKGQGIKMVIRQIGPGMIQQMQQQCSTGKGSGSNIAEKDKCKSCHGEKVLKEKKTLEIHVTKGMKNGEKVVFAGEADEAPDQTPGDVVVVLQQSDHPLYKRDGANLFHKHTITLLEALTGFSFTLQHLDGRTLLVKSDPQGVVKPGDVKAIKEEGMPTKGNPYVRGQLYIEFDVTFPSEKQMTEATKKVLKSVLPPAPADRAGDHMSDTQPEEVTLVTVDFEKEKANFEEQAHREAHDEDEDEEGHHGRRGHGQPQCRQQ